MTLIFVMLCVHHIIDTHHKKSETSLHPSDQVHFSFSFCVRPWAFGSKVQLPQRGAYRGDMKRLTLPGTPSKGVSPIIKSAKITTLFISQPFYCFALFDQVCQCIYVTDCRWTLVRGKSHFHSYKQSVHNDKIDENK